MDDRYDLIIIGGGPAGLTAAIYALRKRLEVLLVSKNLGGKTNYRLQLPDLEHHLIINGEETVNRFLSEIQYLDFARLTDEVEKVEAMAGGYRVETRGGKVQETKTLIVATGAEPQFLNIPGERDYWMRGLCFSAMSYAPLFADRAAIVVGDTHLALMATLELALTARQVVLVAPRGGGLDTPLGERLRGTGNVSILEGYQPQAVRGDLYARALVVAREGHRRELFADGIFVELGLQPNSQIVAGLVDREADGRIKVDSQQRTSAPGILAAGDVTNSYAEQVLIAIGEGAKAALTAYEDWLQQGER